MYTYLLSMSLNRLLGWSTFVGFIALLSVAPLNHYLSKRRIFISRGISAARDRRMAVMNELFVSVKFIKLCAWDERWIQRSEKARAKEIKWIRRERWNNIMLAFVWTCAPILVSVFSFMAFVAQGHELTVSIAFTVCHPFLSCISSLLMSIHIVYRALQSPPAAS
jgi:ABC-type multidrug transport system fused ATPase/permease subunit